ncbi:MAG: SPFH domain-containing protein [Gordonibacter pamelaeae]
MSADDVVIATEAQFDETTASRTGATALRWVLTLIVFFLFAGMAWLTWSLAPVVVGALASAVLFSCMHVVLEWERSVVLRFGRFNRVAGPGLIFMIPLVEYSAATVDMRMRSTAFKAEHVLTADLVPVNVDAVLFWTVWDAGKACSEVKNYVRLVYWAAQTTLRDVMGAVNIAQLSTRREQIDREVADILGAQDERVGHHRGVGGDPRHRDPRRAAGIAVSRGARRARIQRARDPGRGGEGDIGDVRGRRADLRCARMRRCSCVR